MLTKSLHTVTAATNVARLLCDAAVTEGELTVTRDDYRDAAALAAAALRVLGYTVDCSAHGQTADVTVQRIVAACGKILAGVQS